VKRCKAAILCFVTGLATSVMPTHAAEVKAMKIIRVQPSWTFSPFVCTCIQKQTAFDIQQRGARQTDLPRVGMTLTNMPLSPSFATTVADDNVRVRTVTSALANGIAAGSVDAAGDQSPVMLYGPGLRTTFLSLQSAGGRREIRILRQRRATGLVEKSVWGARGEEIRSNEISAELPFNTIYMNADTARFADGSPVPTPDEEPPIDDESTIDEPIVLVPLPAGAWLGLAGLGGVVVIGRRRKIAL
jgi:hypothetical protein